MMATMPALAVKPPHIPDALVFDIDMYNVPGLENGSSDDVHKLWKNIQDTHPDVFWTPRNGGHWFATRYDTIQRAGTDAANFSNRDIYVPRGSAPLLTPTNIDPPEHMKFRKLLLPTFSAAMLNRAADEARTAAISLIDSIRPNGKCEFVSEFSKLMPIIAFMTLINLPLGDFDHLERVAGKLTPDDPESAASWAELSRYVERQIEQRRAEPRDDFLSSLLTAEVDGRKLTTEEVFSMALLVIAGGLDTVAVTLAFVASFLAQHPGHRRQIINDPGVIDRAIEEFLRRFGVSNLARVAAADVKLDGVEIKADESLVLLFPLGGLDERVNERPLEVDFTRRGGRHLMFGAGVHSCIGNRLAKRELRLFLEEWLERIPDFRLAPGTRPKTKTGLGNVVEELNLVWD